jgi:acid phosphatase class B
MSFDFIQWKLCFIGMNVVMDRRTIMKTPTTWSWSNVVVWPTFSSRGFTHGQCGTNHLLSHTLKQPYLWDFLNQDKNNNKPNPKSWLWNKKNKNKNTTHAKQKSNIIFLQGRNKTKQGYDKKMYPKLVLNKLKVIGNLIFIYTHWALSSKKFSKNVQPTCGIYSLICTHV